MTLQKCLQNKNEHDIQGEIKKEREREGGSLNKTNSLVPGNCGPKRFGLPIRGGGEERDLLGPLTVLGPVV